MDLISWDDFSKVELSVERVVNAEIFEKARILAYIPQVGMSGNRVS